VTPAPLPEDSPAQNSLAALEWPRILQALEERLATSYGRARLAELRFLDDLAAIRRSLATIQEMKALIQEAGPLAFAGIQAVDALLERAEKAGRLEVHELSAVLSTQRGALTLAAALGQGRELPLLRDLADEAHLEDALIAALTRAIAPNGELDERTYPALASLRREIGERREAIHRHLDGLLRSRAIEAALQDQVFTLRGRRYVIPVKVEFKGQVPGIVHDVSASGATLFVEPQAVVDETNALTLAEKQLDIEVDRILKELSGQVGSSASSLRHNSGWVGRVDLLHAQARLSHDCKGSAPDVQSGGEIALRALGHPLLLLRGEEVVRNDVRLGADARCLIISGANTGGKTVLLKAIGLCALLVRVGMHLPAAAGSRMDLFPDLWADIGDRQDLRTSLSTFSAQVQFLSRLLDAAGPGSLVLLDELMTGTEPLEGAALARQVLQSLVAQGAKTLVTTHYGELKLLADQIPGVVNGSVAFDVERLRPTYRFSLGMPGASYALPIASRNGLPEELVRRAEESLAGHPAALDALLRRLHAQEERLHAQESDLGRRLAQLARQEAEAERRAADLAGLQARLKRQERGAVSQDLREARRRIALVISELQGANSLPIAGKVRTHLADLEAELLATPAEPAPPPPERPAAVGDAVYVPSLERSGVLRELLDDGKTARVQFGPLTLEVPVAQVLPASAAPPAPPSRLARPPAKARHQPRPGRPPRDGATVTVDVTVQDEIPHVFQTSDNTLDVRGHTLEEALQRTEAFFDQSIVKHVNPVLIIHGHGTGRLKAGLREQFRESRYVERFRPGGPGEGRDGVTVVALNL
jgi:DNA mismatch repair protein MutS2